MSYQILPSINSHRIKPVYTNVKSHHVSDNSNFYREDNHVMLQAEPSPLTLSEPKTDIISNENNDYEVDTKHSTISKSNRKYNHDHQPRYFLNLATETNGTSSDTEFTFSDEITLSGDSYTIGKMSGESSPVSSIVDKLKARKNYSLAYDKSNKSSRYGIDWKNEFPNKDIYSESININKNSASPTGLQLEKQTLEDAKDLLQLDPPNGAINKSNTCIIFKETDSFPLDKQIKNSPKSSIAAPGERFCESFTRNILGTSRWKPYRSFTNVSCKNIHPQANRKVTTKFNKITTKSNTRNPLVSTIKSEKNQAIKKRSHHITTMPKSFRHSSNSNNKIPFRSENNYEEYRDGSVVRRIDRNEMRNYDIEFNNIGNIPVIRPESDHMNIKNIPGSDKYISQSEALLQSDEEFRYHRGTKFPISPGRLTDRSSYERINGKNVSTLDIRAKIPYNRESLSDISPGRLTDRSSYERINGKNVPNLDIISKISYHRESSSDISPGKLTDGSSYKRMDNKNIPILDTYNSQRKEGLQAEAKFRYSHRESPVSILPKISRHQKDHEISTTENEMISNSVVGRLMTDYNSDTESFNLSQSEQEPQRCKSSTVCIKNNNINSTSGLLTSVKDGIPFTRKKYGVSREFKKDPTKHHQTRPYFHQNGPSKQITTDIPKADVLLPGNSKPVLKIQVEQTLSDNSINAERKLTPAVKQYFPREEIDKRTTSSEEKEVYFLGSIESIDLAHTSTEGRCHCIEDVNIISSEAVERNRGRIDNMESTPKINTMYSDNFKGYSTSIGGNIGYEQQRVFNMMKFRVRLAKSHGYDTELTRPVQFYTKYINVFSKGLPHNEDGFVNPEEMKKLIRALNERNINKLSKVKLGGQLKLVNPSASWSYDIIGACNNTYRYSKLPTLHSNIISSEMVELYSMALARDIPFDNYNSSLIIDDCCRYLNIPKNHTQRQAKKSKEESLYIQIDYVADLTQISRVISYNIFRGPMYGDLQGPYISQFLYRDLKQGTIQKQKYASYLEGYDFMKTWNTVISAQNGNIVEVPPPIRNKARYIITGRDLACYVHSNGPYQAFYNAHNILMDLNIPMNPGIMKINNNVETFFVDLGKADIQSSLGLIGRNSLLAAFYVKWNTLFLRPEALGIEIERIYRNNSNPYCISCDLLRNPVLKAIISGNGNALLSQVYPEGAPLHPSTPSESAVVAGACVTVLKFFFDSNYELDAYEPDSNGMKLYNTGKKVTVGDELDKLACNIGIGRCWAGVNYRMDVIRGLKLGEKVAISCLQDLIHRYPHGLIVSFQRFNGKIVTIRN